MSDLACAFVTGAGSGIGRASALALARRVHPISAVDLSNDAAEETAELVRQLGVSAASYSVDVTDANALESAVSFHHRKVQERLVALNVGDPKLIRPGDVEVPIH